MSTDLKFSVITTVIVLGLIVTGALTAVLHWLKWAAETAHFIWLGKFRWMALAAYPPYA